MSKKTENNNERSTFLNARSNLDELIYVALFEAEGGYLLPTPTGLTRIIGIPSYQQPSVVKRLVFAGTVIGKSFIVKLMELYFSEYEEGRYDSSIIVTFNSFAGYFDTLLNRKNEVIVNNLAEIIKVCVDKLKIIYPNIEGVNGQTEKDIFREFTKGLTGFLAINTLFHTNCKLDDLRSLQLMVNMNIINGNNYTWLKTIVDSIINEVENKSKKGKSTKSTTSKEKKNETAKLEVDSIANSIESDF